MPICSVAVPLYHQFLGNENHDSFSRSDVTFTPFEIEEVESAACTLLEALFWMEWWMYAVWFMILEGCNDEAKC